MKINSKDAQILTHIVEYCDEIEITMEWSGFSKKKFDKDFIYLNACAMPLLQIGDLGEIVTIGHSLILSGCVFYL